MHNIIRLVPNLLAASHAHPEGSQSTQSDPRGH